MNYLISILCALALTLDTAIAHARGIAAPAPLTNQNKEFITSFLPQTPVLITHAVGLENYIGEKDSECLTKARSLLELIDSYQHAFHSEGKADPETIYQKMRREYLQPSQTCRTALNRAYLLGSYLIAIDATNVMVRNEYRKMRAFAFSYILLTYDLIKNNHIEFLEQPISVSASSNSAKLIGAYNCNNTLISLSLDRRPFDLAALYSHELSHLLRDKFLTVDYFEKHFSDDREGWHKYIIYDESVAIANQLERQRIQKQVSALEKDPALSYLPVLDFKNDLSFVKWNGPVGEFLKTHNIYNWLVSEFYYKNAAKSREGDSGAKEATDRIIQVVKETYFASPDSIVNFKSVDQELGRSFDPWPELLFPQNYLDTSELAGIKFEDFYYQLKSEGDGAASLLLTKKNIEDLEYVANKIEHSPSPLCSLFMTAIQKNFLDDYVGTAAGKVRPSGGSSSSEGGEGSKGCINLVEPL